MIIEDSESEKVDDFSHTHQTEANAKADGSSEVCCKENLFYKNIIILSLFQVAEVPMNWYDYPIPKFDARTPIRPIDKINYGCFGIRHEKSPTITISDMGGGEGRALLLTPFVTSYLNGQKERSQRQFSTLNDKSSQSDIFSGEVILNYIS